MLFISVLLSLQGRKHIPKLYTLALQQHKQKSRQDSSSLHAGLCSSEAALLYQTGYKRTDRCRLRERYLLNSIQRENRRVCCFQEPGDIFMQHTSLGTSQDKKKWSHCLHFTIYPIWDYAEEAAQPKLKAFLTEPVALLLRLLQVTLG